MCFRAVILVDMGMVVYMFQWDAVQNRQNIRTIYIYIASSALYTEALMFPA